jgi:hypothetical protein
MATANLAAVLTLDDRASAGLVNVANRTQNVSRAMGQSMSTLASFGSSLSQILVTTGALDNQTGRMVAQTLAFTSAGVRLAQVIGLQNSALWAQVAALSAVRRAMVLTGVGAVAVGGGFLLSRAIEGRAQAAVMGGTVVNVDARGATVRSESDLNDVGRQIIQGIAVQGIPVR